MAIVVQSEQGSRLNLIGIVGWMVVIFIVGIAAYYLFFKQPDLIAFTVSPERREEFDTVKKISELGLDPGKISKHPLWSGRTRQISIELPGTMGKNNPFLP